MPVLDPSAVAEETREQTIARAITNEVPTVPGITAVRGITPLVMAALQTANNPYVTAKAGFDAMGITFKMVEVDVEIEGKEEKQWQSQTDMPAASFGIAMMTKTAEVLVLLAADRDTLKRYAVDRLALADAAMDLMEETTPELLAEATVFISGMLVPISKTRAVKAPEDAGPPEATPTAKKKPSRTG